MGKKQLDDLELLKVNQYYIKDLGWNCVELHPSKMMGVLEDPEVCSLISSSYPRNHHRKEGERDFSSKFLMVLFAFLLFVLLELHLYEFFISPTSFFTFSIIFN